MDAERFACTVTPDNRISFSEPSERARFVEHAEKLVGQACELTLEAEPVKASDRQRRWWRGRFIPIVAEEAGYDREERDALHYSLLRECFGVYEKDGMTLPHKASWTQLSVREAWELFEWAVRFAAKTWGVGIRFPSDMEADVLNAIRMEEMETR